MPFSIITIRSQAEDGDALYPSLEAVNVTPVLETGESLIRRLTARSLEIYDFDGGTNRVIALDELKFDVAITDSRLVVWCRKFDKGGGWRGMGLGGLAFAAAANTVSHARAASRRKGRCLVGHIRYPWLKKVGYLTKQGMFTSQEEIRLLVEDGTAGANSRTMALDLRLGSSESARGVAEDILRRAIDFRLAHAPDLDPNERQALEDLRRSGIPRATVTDKFTSVELPGAWEVRSDTAHYPETGRDDDQDLAQTSLNDEIGGSQIAELGGESAVVEATSGSETETLFEPITAPDRSDLSEPSSTPQVALADFCHRCGHRFDDPESFCPDCGAERRWRRTPHEVEPAGNAVDGLDGDTNPSGRRVERKDRSVTGDHPQPAPGVSSGLSDDDESLGSEADREWVEEASSTDQEMLTDLEVGLERSLDGCEVSDRDSSFPCPACGRELPLGARFCARCGVAIAESDDAVGMDPEATVKRRRSP